MRWVVCKKEYIPHSPNPGEFHTSYLITAKNSAWSDFQYQAFVFSERSAAEVVACMVGAEVAEFV